MRRGDKVSGNANSLQFVTPLHDGVQKSGRLHQLINQNEARNKFLPS